MWLANTLYSAVKNKCPRCHKGDVFTKKNPYDLSNIFSMHKSCAHCGLIYQKEVSFFYGAMYISYGLMVVWFMGWYAVENFVLNWPLGWFLFILSISIILLSPLNLRASRLIWLNIFFKYQKGL